jgi:hypothetical protein
MTDVYEIHSTRIVIKPAGRGTWQYETFHTELSLCGQGGADSKAECKRLAERDALNMETNKAAWRQLIDADRKRRKSIRPT